MAGRRLGQSLRQQTPRTCAPVDHVTATASGGTDEPRLDGQLFQEGADDRACLAAREPAEDRVRPELGCHSGDPHALARRVQVHVVPTVAQ